MADFRNYQDQMYATSKSSHSQSTPGSLEQANALEAMCDALFALVGELRDQVGALTARVDELEPRIGAGEEAMRRADLEAAGMTEDVAGFDDAIWSEADEAPYHAERERETGNE